MKLKVFLMLLSVIGVSFGVCARTPQMGHLIVTLSDTEGCPITNATVFVKTLNRTGIMAGTYERDYNLSRACTDSNGVADVAFQFLTSHFDWWLETPSHHSSAFRYQSAFFGAVVTPSDYENIDTNTVDGVRRLSELRTLDEQGNHLAYLQKFVQKNVIYTNAVVHRQACFFPKHNPRPMFAYGNMNYLRFPTNRTECVSNGFRIVRYSPVSVDLKKCAHLPPHNYNSEKGEVEDFRIERYLVVTNGVREFYGRMVFAPGCGAYKGTKTGDQSFPSTYGGDTNAVFQSEITFSSARDIASGRNICVRHLLETNEYMVLRTRLSVNDDGTTNGWHYSKILGPIYLRGAWSFDQSVFNPQLNDLNLEFDTESNLAHSRGGRLDP